jgi:hypothetical protein
MKVHFDLGTLSKGRLFGVLFVAACVLYILLGFWFPTDKVMAVSRNPSASLGPTIRIREIHRAPFLLWPFAWIDDNPQYRFECYAYDSPVIWSCISYTGESFTANNAQIEWSADGTATVSLEHSPLFTCKEGVWSRIRQR